jgi:hypothetical protein
MTRALSALEDERALRADTGRVLLTYRAPPFMD